MRSSKPRKESESDDQLRNEKVVLLGCYSVGKSSLALRFVKDQFQERTESTIGVAFSSKIVHVADQALRLNLWDTGGQERYKSLAPLYYRGANAAIVVYDVTEAGTLEDAQSWIHNLRMNGPNDIPVVLAGNKIDLIDDGKVKKEDGRHLAMANGFAFTEVSARTGQGVNDLFTLVASTIIKRTRRVSKGQALRGIKLEQQNKDSSCKC